MFLSKAGSYTLIKGILHRVSPDLKLKRCLELHEIPKVILALHEGSSGGHFAIQTIVNKTRDVGYWWPTMHKDVHTFIKGCDPC